jgi:hypothetical protein
MSAVLDDVITTDELARLITGVDDIDTLLGGEAPCGNDNPWR